MEIKIDKKELIPYVLIGVAMLFLTILFTAQIHTVQNSSEILQGKREDELIDDVATLQRKYNELKEEYDNNLEIVKEYKEDSSNNSALINSMKEELEYLSVYAGTEDLVGEGIIITLEDGTNITDPSKRADTLVHDSDVLTFINELKAAGAEAISVNGQRIISTSAIRCVGPTILINYEKVASPFIISAIGNSQYLESSINIKNGVADLYKEIGIGVSVIRSDKVEVSKYEGILSYEYSSINEGEDEK